MRRSLLVVVFDGDQEEAAGWYSGAGWNRGTRLQAGTYLVGGAIALPYFE